jgi:hypothetical protein
VTRVKQQRLRPSWRVGRRNMGRPQLADWTSSLILIGCTRSCLVTRRYPSRVGRGSSTGSSFWYQYCRDNVRLGDDAHGEGAAFRRTCRGTAQIRRTAATRTIVRDVHSVRCKRGYCVKCTRRIRDRDYSRGALCKNEFTRE